MEELYRYLLVRPAEAVDLETSAGVINLSQEDSFQFALKNAATQAERGRIAKEFIESDDFIKGEAQIVHSGALVKVADQYRARPITELVETDEVLNTVVDIFVASNPNLGGPDGSTPDAQQAWLQSLTGEASWKESTARLRNSIIAIRETALHSRNMASFADFLRAMQLVSKLAVTGETAVSPGAFLKATFFLPGVRQREAPHEPTEDDLEEPGPDRVALQQEYLRLSNAVNELLSAPLTQMEIEESEERSESGSDDPDGDRSVRVRVTRSVKLGGAFEHLSGETQAVLAGLGLDHETETLDGLVDILRSHQRRSSVDLYSGTGIIISGTSLPVESSHVVGQLGVAPVPYLPTVPQTTGHVAPAGVGDLLVVKQHLKRYEGGDLAHVENILQGETKEREHRRRRMTETIFTAETETEVSEERETQTTSRFEMRLEVQKQLQEEFGVEAGLKVSASYGPTVQVEANTQFSYKNAKSESHSRATSMSKELVDKAATKYREKVREQITRRLVEEAEELNRHVLDASGADQHIVGMYQWLNKIYEAQVYDYGQRTMYEFMIPEPAAYYIWSLARKAEATDSLKVPPPFTSKPFGVNVPLAPRHIHEGNYDQLAARYEAVDVGPPPEPFITVAVEKSGGPNPDGLFVDVDEVKIPEGYEYVMHEGFLDFTGVGPMYLYLGDEFQHPGEIPVVFYGIFTKGYAGYVHLLCRRTDIALEAWRNKVWDALHQGHMQQVVTYEEKLAALMAQAGVQIQGRNPYFNRRVEQTELKKSCITLLTGTYPAWVQSIDDTKAGPVPKTAASKLQGAYVRFMEQAFEWHNMTYVFYPYFWARAGQWQSLLAIEDVDASFQEFLISGFARIVVPVRHGFEKTVEHFRQTGQVWSGGPLPVITDPDYLPIWEEIKERLDAPGEEIAVDEPWEVLVPTQLVKLRNTDALPQWEKQEDGTWHEV